MSLWNGRSEVELRGEKHRDHNGNSQKGSRPCFYYNKIFLLEKTRVIVHPWCVRVDSLIGVFE